MRGIRGAASDMGNKDSGSHGNGASHISQGRSVASPGSGAALADNASGPRAAEPNQPATPDVTSANLALVCAGFTCAVPLTAVREVVAGIPAAPLPDSPAWLLGVMQWRGELIALIDPLPILTGNAAAQGGPWRRVGRSDRGGPAAWRPIIGLARGAGRGADPSGLSENGAAIVLGDDTRCIALAVDTVDTLGSLVSSAAGSAAGHGKAVPVLPRYTAGMTAMAGGSSYPVLRTGALLADVVAALTKEGGSADE